LREIRDGMDRNRKVKGEETRELNEKVRKLEERLVKKDKEEEEENRKINKGWIDWRE
jgi:hypothetical protein